jgi:hypothetical protein
LASDEVLIVAFVAEKTRGLTDDQQASVPVVIATKPSVRGERTSPETKSVMPSFSDRIERRSRCDLRYGINIGPHARSDRSACAYWSHCWRGSLHRDRLYVHRLVDIDRATESIGQRSSGDRRDIFGDIDVLNGGLAVRARRGKNAFERPQFRLALRR